MKIITLITAMAFLSGCQAIMEEHRRQMVTMCTYDGAFSEGVQDAESGEGSQASQKLSSCTPNIKSQALRGYNDGYASVRANDNSIGGIIGSVIDSHVKVDSSYNCEIEVFTDTFSAKGSSRAEALHNAKQVCTSRRDGDDFFCKKSSEYKCFKLY